MRPFPPPHLIVSRFEFGHGYHHAAARISTAIRNMCRLPQRSSEFPSRCLSWDTIFFRFRPYPEGCTPQDELKLKLVERCSVVALMDGSCNNVPNVELRLDEKGLELIEQGCRPTSRSPVKARPDGAENEPVNLHCLSFSS